MKSRGTSRLKALHKQNIEERRKTIAQWVGDEGLQVLESGLSIETADRMVENVVGVMGIPLGVATNFIVNGQEVLLPMAIEEPSVIAAASNAAKMVRAGSGFEAEASPPLMAVQIEILDPSPEAGSRIEQNAAEIVKSANDTQPELVALGGGARKLVVRENVGGPERLVVHIIVDCLDAMGANSVNTMAEAVSPTLAQLAEGRQGLRILTNLADDRLVRASCLIPFGALERKGFSGEEVAYGVVAASDFAWADPYRAATHNKGIFNGMDAVLVATGNDWRAVEAGGHAFAARSGVYQPLSKWMIRGNELAGTIELPMAVGIVGGAAKTHPTARTAIRLMGIERAGDLACVVASAGLASNLAALAALASEGIQKGHMRLHERKLS